MTEEQARAWLVDRLGVSRETMARLEAFVAVLLTESARQNLISAATREHVWSRHIVDSAQLLLHAPPVADLWADVGAGAGLPGLVLAILRPDLMFVLIESRRLRAGFLEQAGDELGLGNLMVEGKRVETCRLPAPVAVISARAYAPLPRLFQTTLHLAGPETRWLLPKGRNSQNELANARAMWQGEFHVERSVTDPESAILVASNVRKRGSRA